MPLMMTFKAFETFGAATLCAALAAAQPAATPVSLKAPDGVTLKASYYSPGKPGPGLLLLHQCNADRSTWAGFAKSAVARGYHVLALDYRGFGESEGQKFTDFQALQPVIAEKWPGDVDAAFAFLVTQTGVDKDRIGASGASCGVNQAVALASRHPEVKTVVLLSGGLSPEARAYLQKSAWMPVMASASADDGDAVNTMRWILGWSRNPQNKFVEFKAAGHGTEMFAVEKTLEPQMLDWFDANLRNAPAKPAATTANSKPSRVEEFWSTLAQPGGAAKAQTLFQAAKTSGDKVVLFPEAEMNAYGYQLLQEGRNKDAVIVFQMNVEAYPESANVYDSLADAFLADGNKSEALRYAERTLQLLDADTRTPPALKKAIRESAEKKVRDLKK